ncbi:Epoxyqueuosine reductase QueG (queuosine biosynthesis) [Desulfacinum hydrothermale DSM 13146]|uniref:Epoxyqueuosine reductase QueG (Queuosine biosynthesis) n=1 Tax=Desulfacinum hydrothermale DSM 13146 TaxID=1121390 RepID=A0A1W1XPP6_9BACT|nr:epoxyqueuosine reductase [Desulfacinum hydrothermale]SMC25960.1 Epoxyqueuosine reductase QueG (queuosine biosynthesis) [Desulfacinum hydrothermale DSM 13146]
MAELSRIVREFAEIEGACAAGIVTPRTLSGGPPSTDLSYVLPQARSAVVFAVPMDPAPIDGYLRKEDRLSLERAYVRANTVASGIALHLANFLAQKGYPSAAVAANNVFRPASSQSGNGCPADSYYPDIAHRYLAVRSGVGHMGFSGNVITKDHGAAVILGTVVTEADLAPTEPLAPEESYCDRCGLCRAACASGFMDFRNTTRVVLGGVEIAYSGRRHYGRCDLVCSGYTGLHPSGKWSTWSPGRFPVPDRDEDLPAAYERMQKAHASWPASEGGRYFFFMDEKLRFSCGHCMLICHPSREERKRRYQLLRHSGVVVQMADGTRKAVTPHEARTILDAMHPERRILYEDV